MVVIVGLTFGLALVSANPVGYEVQLYVFPLIAVEPMEALPPEQIVLPLPALAAGKGLTVITAESDLPQLVAVIFSVR